jgi:hypothetical protein
MKIIHSVAKDIFLGMGPKVMAKQIEIEMSRGRTWEQAVCVIWNRMTHYGKFTVKGGEFWLRTKYALCRTHYIYRG